MLDETDESEELGGERKERRRKDSGASEQPEEEVTAFLSVFFSNATDKK